MSHDLDDLERLLRTARATPRAEFVRELERSLPGPRVARDRRRLRVAIAGSGLATALAAVAFALSVTGLLPFTHEGGHRAQARQDCRFTRVERVGRDLYFVRDGEGKLGVRYRVEKAPRLVRRCR